MAINVHWITDDTALKNHCAAWRGLPFIALDTEFIRVDTFYPLAGLLQICADAQVYLLDPLLIKQWQPLAELLEAPELIKVLHACGEDLEVLQRLAGSLPQPLFDTQLAAGFLNLGFSMGYSRLVQAVLGLELPKGETRSDWLQRPLSEMQIRYAAEDTLHLAELYQALVGRLTEQKYQWVLQDGAELVANQLRVVDPKQLYIDAKLSWKLSRQQLAVLRDLCAWRDQQARERDQPRNRILKEHCLWPLARFQPKDLGALSRIEEMHPRTVRQDGETILALITQAASSSPDSWPEPVPEPLPLEAGALLKRLRAVGQRQAEQLEIVPELMLRKKSLEALLKSGFPNGPYQLPENLRGWRRELMGQALLDCLAGEL